jgi:hypothetical protein
VDCHLAEESHVAIAGLVHEHVDRSKPRRCGFIICPPLQMRRRLAARFPHAPLFLPLDPFADVCEAFLNRHTMRFGAFQKSHYVAIHKLYLVQVHNDAPAVQLGLEEIFQLEYVPGFDAPLRAKTVNPRRTLRSILNVIGYPCGNIPGCNCKPGSESCAVVRSFCGDLGVLLRAVDTAVHASGGRNSISIFAALIVALLRIHRTLILVRKCRRQDVRKLSRGPSLPGQGPIGLGWPGPEALLMTSKPRKLGDSTAPEVQTSAISQSIRGELFPPELLRGIRLLIENARGRTAAAVNSEVVTLYWLVVERIP